MTRDLDKGSGERKLPGMQNPTTFAQETYLDTILMMNLRYHNHSRIAKHPSFYGDHNLTVLSLSMFMLGLISPLSPLLWMLYAQYGGRFKRRLAYPFCGNCTADLRQGWDGTMHCHQCGASLEKPHAVYFGKKAKPYTRQRRIRDIVLGILFLVVINVGMVLTLGFGWGMPLSLKVSKLNNTQLIAELPANMDEFMCWVELENRHKANKLSPEELEQIVTIISNDIESPQTDRARTSFVSGPWIESLLISGAVSNTTATRLLKAYFGKPHLESLFHAKRANRPWTMISFSREYENLNLAATPPLVPYVTLIKAVSVDEPDKPLQFRNRKDYGKADMPLEQSLYLSKDTDDYFYMHEDLKPGEHELIFTFDYSYYPGKTFTTKPTPDQLPMFQYIINVQVTAHVNEQGDIEINLKPTPDTTRKEH